MDLYLIGNVIGFLLLALCALVTAVNLYLFQPITLLRHGAKATKNRASLFMVFGDLMAVGAFVFLSLGDAVPRAMVPWVVLPVWLLNPGALVWIPAFIAMSLWHTRQEESHDRP